MKKENYKIERYNPDFKIGLSDEQIKERIENNLINRDISIPTKSIKTIIATNVFTLFNFLNLFLAIAVFSVKSYKNLFFLGVVICNTLISTIQEIHSKKIVDKLSVISSTKVTAIRSGIKKEITINEIVLDDILEFRAGNQIVTDCVICSGEVEVNESYITGESDNVLKKAGDMLLSGSFIVSGKAIGKVEHISEENYTATISKEAKYIKKCKSEIMSSLNKIIKIVTTAIIPVGLLLFFNQLGLDGNDYKHAVVNTVAAIIGMIPEGLVLLTSTVLAVSVIRLSKKKVLVQELFCIENLARVDVLCLDKTGTITEGNMEVIDIIPVFKKKQDMEQILTAISNMSDDTNQTMTAIKEKYNKTINWEVIKKIPFSSDKKWSGITFKNQGTYILGALEIILKEKLEDYKEILKDNIEKYRVIVLGHTKELIESNVLPQKIEIIGFILISDKIRKDAKETLEYFKEQGVEIKIISGDNPITVSKIAMQAGVENSDKYIDATTLTNDTQILEAVSCYTVFGRVSPIQKKKIIMALKEKGHTVAMTGDGVNDVLALKEADCSIAVASGSDASRNVAQLVLLDSDFKSMPDVVAEGRRTINNISRSATLFLAKTIYATILAILFVFINEPYPFMPIQLSLISIVTIGIPSFILALEPNKERVKGNFLQTIISKAIPTALTVILNIILIVIIQQKYNLSVETYSTLCVISTAIIGLTLLLKLSLPFNILRCSLFIFMILLFLGGILILEDWFSIILSKDSYIFIGILAITGITCFILFNYIAKKIFKIE